MRYLLHFESFKNPDNKWKNYTYKDNHIGYHHQQNDYRVDMYDNGDKVAYANYCEFQEKVYINFIESIIKGKGYGQMIMEYLADKYGYENLERSSLTDDGVKLRKKLDSKFGFDYNKYKDSLNKHIDQSIIKKIESKHPIVGQFILDMVKYGYEKTWEKWIDFLHKDGLLNKYDFNDISEITYWVRDSVTNDNNPEDSPPDFIMELVNQLLEN